MKIYKLLILFLALPLSLYSGRISDDLLGRDEITFIQILRLANRERSFFGIDHFLRTLYEHEKETIYANVGYSIALETFIKIRCSNDELSFRDVIKRFLRSGPSLHLSCLLREELRRFVE